MGEDVRGEYSLSADCHTSCYPDLVKAFMKRQNDRILKEELPRSVGETDQWRNNSRNNEGMEPKQKQYPVVDVTGDKSKVRCCKSNIA